MFSKQCSFSTNSVFQNIRVIPTNSSNRSTILRKRLVRWNWAAFSLKNEIDQFLRLVAIFVFDFVCLRNGDICENKHGLKHEILNTEHRIQWQCHVSGVKWRHRPECDLATNDVKETFMETFGVFGSSEEICTKSIKQRELQLMELCQCWQKRGWNIGRS